MVSAVSMLRKWQQNFFRVRELHAALPDSSLLLKGVDHATSSLLVQNPLLGFRVNAFRNRVSLDYNPSVSTVLQFVRLLQAEFESASLSQEGSTQDKRAALLDPSPPPKAEVPKPPGPPPGAQAKAIGGIPDGKGKGKGKDKGKDSGRDVGLCHAFADKKGCKFGDACRFKHDRAAARKQGRCLACGQECYYRPDRPNVAPENRQVTDQGNPSSGGPSPKAQGAGPGPKTSPLPKPKAVPQSKSITEDSGAESSLSVSTSAQEALMAEAAKVRTSLMLSTWIVVG